MSVIFWADGPACFLMQEPHEVSDALIAAKPQWIPIGIKWLMLYPLIDFSSTSDANPIGIDWFML